MQTIPKPLKIDSGSVQVAECAEELMNAAVSLHKLHLKITGTGSYAAHNALKVYEDLPEHADDLVEQYQGITEQLITTYPEKAPKILKSVEEAVKYLKDIRAMIEKLQSTLPYSELVNILDETKSTIDSAKYKLIFLK